MSNRDIYVAKLKLQLDELNASIGQLEAQAQAAKKEWHANYKEQIAGLQKQSDQAAVRIEEIKTATENSWEALVTEMDKTRDALVHSFHYFKSQL